MLLKGSLATKKTGILVKEYVKLLNSGVEASEILVLVQNSTLKGKFCDEVLEKTSVECIEKLQVYSFFGLVYNTILDNWAFVENIIPSGTPKILPNLVGLEVSQFVLKNIIKDVRFAGYNSKKSLLHQLFRRYSLIVQNNLSDDDVKWRSEDVLKEGFGDDAHKALKGLLGKTLTLRGFDYLRQGLIFNYIYRNSDCFSKIKYLFVDDGDEVTPICFDFIKYLAEKNKVKPFIAYDIHGASRIGYLSADNCAVYGYEKLFGENPETLEENSKISCDAKILYENVLSDKTEKLRNLTLVSPSKRAQMLDLSSKKVKELLKNGAIPKDIVIITPVIDDMLKFCLRESLSGLLFLSGSEKLIQNRLVHSCLVILKMTSDMKESLSEFDLRILISDFLEIPIKYCKTILEKFSKAKTLIEYEFADSDYTDRYNKLRDFIQNENLSNLKLSECVIKIYEDLAEIRNFNLNEINKFNFFVKQLEDFEDVFGEKMSKSDVIVQVENSIISENPYSTLEIRTEDLIVATPQKVIDNQIRSKYQIWLDVSSDDWVKSDTGPLYNAWVFQSGWDKDEFTIEDNLQLSHQKTARILRKLLLCSEEKVYAFSSLFDSVGVENFGGIEKYLNFEKDEAPKNPSKPIIPRPDQKPVLDYENGKMAISAVPGAGKTTILLALILKLMEKDVEPENIYVLTYMESAARNFRERIKNIRQDSSKLPNISTIHGLALKILKENGNFERLGLPADFEICDDSQRSRLVGEISGSLKLKKYEAEDFGRAVSVIKLGQGSPETTVNDTKVKKFLDFYKQYQTKLKEANLIDYDDMLLSSVKLLEENKDILEYYQEICEYIIEDEAQDSSAIQQRLINLLSAKHKNLIRCGDINQAITTTFSNADVEGFRKFIKESNPVSMDCSQRCCKDVWQLANNLVKVSQSKPECKNAFFEIFMHPVEGRNPDSKNAIHPFIAENTLAEKNYALKQIKRILKENPKATVGILLRNNYQVAQWLGFINNAGLKSITRSESLEQKGVFRAIFAILKMVQTPFDNEIIAQSYETLAELGFYKQRMQIEIRKSAQPFISISADDIENMSLAQFYWDFSYWLSLSSLAIEELAIKIGLFYYSSEIEKSNVYLISTLIKRLAMANSDFTYVVQRLEELSKKPSLSGFKFFSEEDESDKKFVEGKVQVMTMHKSKGDEFDYVFLPELSESNLTLDYNELKMKASSDFMEQVRALNPKYKAKNEDELKKFTLAENLRLMYVAITRAKRGLYLSVPKISKSFQKEITQTPSIIFEELLGYEGDCV